MGAVQVCTETKIAPRADKNAKWLAATNSDEEGGEDDEGPDEPPAAMQDWARSGGKSVGNPSTISLPPTAKFLSMSRGNFINSRDRPDPRFVEHVTVEQYVKALDNLDNVERMNAELTREIVELTQKFAASDSELRRCRIERNSLSAELMSSKSECDRLCAAAVTSEQQLRQLGAERVQLQQELRDAGLTQEALEVELTNRSHDVGKARKSCEQLEQRNRLLHRKLQSLRGLACPECRFRSRASDMNAVEGFYGDL
jgi:hypothetical protein